MCKIKFESEDGKLFSTQEECREYEETPKIYLVIDIRGLSIIPVKAFLLYKEALSWKIQKQGDSIYSYYRIDMCLLESHKPTTIKPDRTLPVSKTVFQQLKELVCGKG